MDPIKNENNNYKISNGNYVFPGNLKIPVKTIENMPQEDRNELLSFMSGMKDAIKSEISGNNDIFMSKPLSINSALYVSCKNNEINFYISNESSGQFTQILSVDKAAKIQLGMDSMIENIKQLDVGDRVQDYRDQLISGMVQSTYQFENAERGSPEKDYKMLADDFDLDL